MSNFFTICICWFGVWSQCPLKLPGGHFFYGHSFPGQALAEIGDGGHDAYRADDGERTGDNFICDRRHQISTARSHFVHTHGQMKALTLMTEAEADKLKLIEM